MALRNLIVRPILYAQYGLCCCCQVLYAVLGVGQRPERKARGLSCVLTEKCYCNLLVQVLVAAAGREWSEVARKSTW